MEYILIAFIGFSLLGSGCSSVSSKNSAKQDQFQEVCTREPLENEAGALTFPIRDRYKDLPHLGQIFTAMDCRRSDIERIQGFQDHKYGWGALLTWKKAPVESAGNELETLGFIRVTDNQWKIERSMSLSELERLKSIIERALLGGDVISEDCVRCG